MHVKVAQKNESCQKTDAFAKVDKALCTSQIEASTSPPPGNPRAFVFFGKFLLKFPPPEAEKLFKCPIIGPFQVIKCPHPRETFR